MTLPPVLVQGLRLPLIAAPMFRVSGPALVVAQCRAGIVGSFPAANARAPGELDAWLHEIRAALAAHDAANPSHPAAAFAVNLIVHRSNARLEQDLAVCLRHAVPLVITSLGVRPDVNAAIHGGGGLVLHDVTTIEHAHKAIERGADGLVAVAAGAGGHAGSLSPFALIGEVRSWWPGPLALSGAIATGRAILAARVLGADLAYVGSPFIATHESLAQPEYKHAVVAAQAADILYTDAFTGVRGNYLRPSIAAAGLDPDRLAPFAAGTAGFSGATDARAWRDIWGCGQGVGPVTEVVGTAALVARLEAEYREARQGQGSALDPLGAAPPDLHSFDTEPPRGGSVSNGAEGPGSGD